MLMMERPSHGLGDGSQGFDRELLSRERLSRENSSFRLAQHETGQASKQDPSCLRRSSTPSQASRGEVSDFPGASSLITLSGEPLISGSQSNIRSSRPFQMPDLYSMSPTTRRSSMRVSNALLTNTSPMQHPPERAVPKIPSMRLDSSMQMLLKGQGQSVDRAKDKDFELDMNLPFPAKLHYILSNPKYQDLIAWLPHGRAWRILKPKAFEKRVIPKLFRSAKYASFMRQVSLHG